MIDSRVRVYRNLHTGNFSVQSTATGRIIAHMDSLTLRDVKFVVRKAGHEKVLKQKRKNVHAFVVGYICKPTTLQQKEVKYNPYVADYFWLAGSQTKIEKADLVRLQDNKIFI